MADSQQQNFNPDEPLVLSSTGKQCLENSTDRKCDSSSNKLEAASSTDNEEAAIDTTDPQTLTYGKHRLPINEMSKPSLSRSIQLRESIQIPVASARVESQVCNGHAEIASSSQTSGSAVGSLSKKNASPQVESQVNNEHASSSQTSGSAANSPSKKNASPQGESQVTNDQAEKASTSQASGPAAGSPHKANPSPQGEFQVNNDHIERTSSSQTPESAAGSPSKEKSPQSFRFSEEQLEILVKEYEKNEILSYPNVITKLASDLGVEYNQVHNWFCQRWKNSKNGTSNQASEPKPPSRKWRQCKRRELDLLEVEFKKNPYPTPKVQDEMSEKINLSAREIVLWFKNRRRKELKKMNQPPTEPSKQESD